MRTRRAIPALVLLALLYAGVAATSRAGAPRGARDDAPHGTRDGARDDMRDGARDEARGRLVPAHDGHVEELAIQFHREGAARFLPVFESLFGALAPDTRVWVGVADAEDRARFEEARAGWRGGARDVRYVTTGHAITSWARDRLAVLAPADGRVSILAPPAPMAGPEARVRDWLVPWALRRTLGERARIETAPFAFEGGDLIADESHVFVASPLFARNPDLAPSALVARVAGATGLDVVRIGDDAAPSPDHHIGMFLTPLGDGRVAYADVGAGLAAIGDAALLEVASGERVRVDRLAETRARFDRVREDLEASGLVPVPIPLVPTTERYVFLGYDNVLLDERATRGGGTRLHVLLPVYGVDALDEAAANAWRERADAVVHPIPVHDIFRLGGTVRCLVAPLVRRAPRRGALTRSR